MVLQAIFPFRDATFSMTENYWERIEEFLSMHKFSKYASGRNVLILFIATMSVYAWIVFASIPAVLEEAPDLVLFDMSPLGYSFEFAVQLLDGIGEEGRRRYLFHQLPIDLVYPGLFAVTYTLMLIWVAGKFANKKSWLFTLAYIPFVAGILDYLENLGIFIMLVSYPDLDSGIVLSASICTVLKSVMTVLFYVLLIYSFIAWGINHKAQPRAGGDAKSRRNI